MLISSPFAACNPLLSPFVGLLYKRACSLAESLSRHGPTQAKAAKAAKAAANREALEIEKDACQSAEKAERETHAIRRGLQVLHAAYEARRAVVAVAASEVGGAAKEEADAAWEALKQEKDVRCFLPPGLL